MSTTYSGKILEPTLNIEQAQMSQNRSIEIISLRLLPCLPIFQISLPSKAKQKVDFLQTSSSRPSLPPFSFLYVLELELQIKKSFKSEQNSYNFVPENLFIHFKHNFKCTLNTKIFFYEVSDNSKGVFEATRSF